MFSELLLQYWSNEKVPLMKVIEDDLRQLLKQVSFHDTDWALLQLDTASVLATFAPYYLSQ